MELAEYYGGAPSGGMYHMGGAFSGGVGKKTGRSNRSSAFMECKRREYGLAKQQWEQGLLPEKPLWVKFRGNCQTGIRQPPLRRERPLRLRKSGVARKRRSDFAISRPFPARIPCDIRGQMMSLPELRLQAKMYGIKGYSKMRKADLCAVVDAYSYAQ